MNQDTEIVSHVQRPFLEGNPAGDGGYETALSGAFTYRIQEGKHNLLVLLWDSSIVAKLPFPTTATCGRFRSQATRYSTHTWYPIKLENDQSLNLELSIKNLTDEFYYRGAMIPETHCIWRCSLEFLNWVSIPASKPMAPQFSS